MTDYTLSAVDLAVNIAIDLAACSADWDAPETVELSRQFREVYEELEPHEMLDFNAKYNQHVLGNLLGGLV